MSETKPPRQKLSRKAFDEGKQAREEQKPRDSCPYTPDQRSQVRAWEQGWDSLGPVLPVARIPNVHLAVPGGVQVRAEVTIATAAKYADPSRDLSKQVFYTYTKIACPACRCEQLPSGSQACVYLRSPLGALVAGFMCRACGNRFKVPLA